MSFEEYCRENPIEPSGNILSDLYAEQVRFLDYIGETQISEEASECFWTSIKESE